jgi:predicted ribosome quality control (RQC) complex YloA/Tae2 family protein
MQKKNISSVELVAIMNELKFLTNAKVSQIYQPDPKELILQLHVPRKGKQLLRIFPGMFLNLTNKKESTLRPSGMSLQLRKYLNNSFIREIYQKDSERIVVLTFEKAHFENDEKILNSYHIIIELFSKGNLILTNQDWKIITSTMAQVWESRTIKVREKYEFPPNAFNWKESSEKNIVKIVKNSDKRNVATCLATEISLGGVFAEEVCKQADVDPKTSIEDLAKKDLDAVAKEIKNLVNSLEKSKGYFYEDQISPIKLKDQEEVRVLDTFNEALDTLNPLGKVSPYRKKIEHFQKIIKEQEQAIKDLECDIELNTKKGELVYEKYQQLQKLIDIVNEMKKSKDWVEIGKDLRKEKKIKKVDLQKKKVKVDL